jgi:hypothetical protein
MEKVYQSQGGPDAANGTVGSGGGWDRTTNINDVDGPAISVVA